MIKENKFIVQDIMEENKYYVPEIEEFCVGFECEMINSSHHIYFEWEKCKFKEDFSCELSEDYCFEYLFSDLKNKNIRVKYLDKEDIESLGFTLHYKPHNKKFYFKNQDEKIGITLRKDFYNDGFCNAHIYELREPISTLFSGKIKNKTELIKLLKQLDINYGI